MMSDTQVSARIAEAEVDAFQADGAVCLRGVVDPSWIELLKTGTEKVLAAPGRYGRTQSKRDDPGFFFTEYFMCDYQPEMRRFGIEGPGGAIAARLLRADQVRFFYDGLFVKEPGTARRSDWHQDQPYYPVNGRQVVVLWTPMDPAPAEVALQVVRGSHLWAKAFTPVIFSTEQELAFDDSYAAAPDIDAAREDYEVLSWDVEPGDVIAFHGMALHGAAGNPTGGRRRASQTTWLGDDAVFARRPGRLEPHFEHLDYPEGMPLTDAAAFPKVWPRD
jgi:hypothetical protein